MKAVNEIYMPVKSIVQRKKPAENKQCFCLDSKEHPRMYKSMETLEQYMPEEFDYIYVYQLKKIINPKGVNSLKRAYKKGYMPQKMQVFTEIQLPIEDIIELLKPDKNNTLKKKFFKRG